MFLVAFLYKHSWGIIFGHLSPSKFIHASDLSKLKQMKKHMIVICVLTFFYYSLTKAKKQD